MDEIENEIIDTPADDTAEPLNTSLRDELSKAFSEYEAKEAAPAESAETKPETVRDEKGKFSEKVAPVVSEPSETVKPPASWGETAKAKFSKLDPEIQKEITKREGEMQLGATKFDEERNFGRDMQKTISPYLPTVRQVFGNEKAAVSDMLHFVHVLSNAPRDVAAAEYLKVANKFGLTQHLQAATQQASRYVDPEIADLQKQVSQLVNQQQQSTRINEQQVQEIIRTDIEKFAQDPANVHFQTVRPLMGHLLNTKQAKDLQDAYDKAVWGTPETRSTMFQAKLAEEQAKQSAEQKAKAEKARRASGSVYGSPVSVPQGGKPGGSLRDQIAAAYDDVVGNA